MLHGKPVFGPAKPIIVMDASAPVPRRIGLRDVEQVAVISEQLGRLAGDLGGIPMTEALTAHTRASEAMLGAPMREPVRQRLLIALADAHCHAGWAAEGAGLRQRAHQHFVRRIDCAAAAGDLLRAVSAVDSLGRLELDAGQPNEALKLFQLGAAAAPSALSRSRLEYDCACALGLLGIEGEALAALRRAHDSYQAGSDEPRPWLHFAAALPHIEGCTYLALGHFDRAVVALLAAAQLRCGEVRSGLHTAVQVIRLAKGLRSVSVRHSLAPLREAAAARRDSACQDLARELMRLRSAA